MATSARRTKRERVWCGNGGSRDHKSLSTGLERASHTCARARTHARSYIHYSMGEPVTLARARPGLWREGDFGTCVGTFGEGTVASPPMLYSTHTYVYRCCPADADAPAWARYKAFLYRARERSSSSSFSPERDYEVAVLGEKLCTSSLGKFGACRGGQSSCSHYMHRSIFFFFFTVPGVWDFEVEGDGK